MPLLTISEIEQLVPALKGTFGNLVARGLRSFLGIKELSDINDLICENKGADFAGALLKHLNVDYRIGNAERLESLPEGPFITISNHPYGGIDGIILADLIGHIREDYKIVVNKILSMVESLTPSLIVVDPKNLAQQSVTAANVNGVKEVLQSVKDGKSVGIFPAGAVSNLYFRPKPVIEDREWQKGVLKIIRKAQVPIVPIKFIDHNSAFFYNLGLIDWKIRVGQLPKEILNKKGKSPRIVIGETIGVEEQQRFSELNQLSTYLRNKVYSMKMPANATKRSELQNF